MKKSIKKTMSLLLCTAMMAIIMLPQAAFAATDYTCYIGSNGYSTLAEAVEAANAGDTIWMTANDSTTTNITVDKSVIIELEGYTLQNVMFTFTGDIDVALNDRKGEAKINTNHNSGNTIAVKNGASLTISGENYGTEIYGSENDSDKTIYVYANSHLTLNGGSILFAGEYKQDGIFLDSKATLTINDCYVGRYNESNTNGGSLSLTSTPSEAYPVIIKKGRFKAGMWLGGTTSLATIEEKVLATSKGSYIDYEKTVDGSSTKQWDIYIASKTLSTETEVENTVDAQNTLRVTTGGNISVKAGDSIVFEPRVSGGTQDEITYTWTKDGADTGVDTGTFVIEATTSDDAGEYVFTAMQGSNSVSCTYVLSVELESKLFSTTSDSDLLSKAVDGKLFADKDYVYGVVFTDLNEHDLTDVTTLDYSADGNGSVLAWRIDNDLYIGGYGKIIAGDSLAYAFYKGEYIKSITGLEFLDTSKVTDMRYMFYYCGNDQAEFTLDLGENFDTSKVTDMSYMFCQCGSYRSFILDLGDKFDTHNVKNMNSMFDGCGYGNSLFDLDFTLDLGDGFDTSNVTTMSLMFNDCGYNSSNFTLDLGDKFNTSNVTTMNQMFYCCGKNSTNFTLDLGDKFNTSNVTTMNQMFYFCGKNSTEFTLDLGECFDTIKVVTMKEMFYHCGSSSDAFNVLDLSSFTISSETTLMGFASCIPVSRIIFGDGWKNANLPEAGNWYLSAFYAPDAINTTIVNATDNLLAYDWTTDNRIVTFEGNLPVDEPKYEAENGGTIDVVDNEDGTVTLSVSVPDGFRFVGWHDGTEIISTDNPYTFVPEAGKTYTAKLEEIQPDPVNKYTITANATDGGVAEGTATVEEGQSVTLTATANEGYKFIGWFDGDTKVCETEEFTVENVTSDKTYTAKFELIEIDEPIEPSGFDFDSIRTGNGQNISVDHENRKISVDVEEGDNLVLYVHQKDIIPGGQIRMNSYNGYKVKYDASGVYRIYTIDDTSVTVSAKVTIDGVTEIYDLQVNYKELNSEFDFEKISCENGETFEIDHDARTIRIYAEKDAEYVTLYKDQSEFVNGKLILTSFMGNRVQSNQADGTYKVCFVKNKEVSVKGNISIGGVTKEYTIISVFSLDWGFDSLKAENATITAIDHTAKTVTMKASDSSVQLFIDQTDLKGNAQVWMKSYNGNKVKYNANDRTYTITQGTSESLTVSIKVTIYGETRYYDLILNF